MSVYISSESLCTSPQRLTLGELMLSAESQQEAERTYILTDVIICAY